MASFDFLDPGFVGNAFAGVVALGIAIGGAWHNRRMNERNQAELDRRTGIATACMVLVRQATNGGMTTIMLKNESGAPLTDVRAELRAAGVKVTGSSSEMLGTCDAPRIQYVAPGDAAVFLTDAADGDTDVGPVVEFSLPTGARFQIENQAATLIDDEPARPWRRNRRWRGRNRIACNGRR